MTLAIGEKHIKPIPAHTGRQRLALSLSRGGMPVREIAQKMQIGERAVNRLIGRAIVAEREFIRAMERRIEGLD